LHRAAETLRGIRADNLWEDVPKDAAYQSVRRQSPHFTGAQVHIDNIPLAVDRTESVPNSFKDFLGYASKSEFFCCSSPYHTRAISLHSSLLFCFSLRGPPVSPWPAVYYILLQRHQYIL